MNTKYMNDYTCKLFPQTFTQTKHMKIDTLLHNTNTNTAKHKLNQTSKPSMLWRSEP